MDLHRRIGTFFTFFCAFAISINVIIRDNPDFWTNVLSELILMGLFALSIIMPKRFGGGVQVAALLVCAALAPTSPGGPFFSAFILIFIMILSYAYSGYVSVPLRAWAFVASLTYGVMLYNLSKLPMALPDLFIRSFSWSSFIMAFCYVIWVIYSDMDRRFHTTRETELLKTNGELLQLGKDLMEQLEKKECDDATGKPS